MESRAILHDKVQHLLEQEADDRADRILDAMFGPVPADNFMQELIISLNKHGKDNDCNTPDFVLGEYLCMCLDVFKYNIKYRESTQSIKH